MKKLILLMSICLLLLGGLAHADPIKISDVLAAVPLKQGVAYSLVDSEFKYTTTFDVIEKWGLSWEVGYVGDDELITGINFDLGKLQKFVNVPILKYVDLDLGFFYGLDRISRGGVDSDYGISVKVCEISF